MEDFGREVLDRLPLAEAVWTVLGHVADDVFLAELYRRHKGGGRERVLSFPALVGLLSDALVQHGGSGRQALSRAEGEGVLPVSAQAVYGKLSRLAPGLSEAFLSGCTDRLRTLRP